LSDSHLFRDRPPPLPNCVKKSLSPLPKTLLQHGWISTIASLATTGKCGGKKLFAGFLIGRGNTSISTAIKRCFNNKK